jgi:hypothetical protein
MKLEKPRNKTAALDTNLPVVRSAKLPALRKEEYRDFDDFAQKRAYKRSARNSLHG